MSKRAGTATGSTPEKKEGRKSKMMELLDETAGEGEDADVEVVSDSAGGGQVDGGTEAPPAWFQQYEQRQNKKLNALTKQLKHVSDTVKQTKEEMQEIKGNIRELRNKVVDLEGEVEMIKGDMDDLYVTQEDVQTMVGTMMQDMVGAMIEERIKHTMHDRQPTAAGGTRRDDGEGEARHKQVIAFGFADNTPSASVVEHLDGILKQLLGDGVHANVTTGSDVTKMGMMEFPSVQAKIAFWKKAQDALNKDEHAFGQIFFRNNLTKEERDHEKRLGYTKYYLQKHSEYTHRNIKIIWSKKMVVLRDSSGKERKVAWYDGEGEWHTTKAGKA
eukprot:7077556-Pyramimonas_sp.AAC.1